MYWYILFSLIVVAILSGVLIYYYSYEGFQTSSTDGDLSGAALVSSDNFHTNGVDLNALARDLSGSLQGATPDRRPINSGPRLCEGFINQISAMEKAMEEYRKDSDWDNVRRTTETLQSIRKQETEAGCQNNNT
jgi:hypothetical protein